MEQELQKQEIIDRYLREEMEEAEKAAFEVRLKEEPELRQDVAIQHDLLAGVDIHEITTTLGKVRRRLEGEGFFLNETHIRDYLIGELEPGLLLLFEKRLQEDAAFAREVQLEKDMLGGIALHEEAKERDKIHQITRKLEKEGFFEEQEENAGTKKEARVVSLFRIRNLAVAATVLLLMVAGFFLFQPASNPYKTAFSEHFQPETGRLEGVLEELESPGFATDRTQSRRLLDALRRYQEADYQAAAKALKQYLNSYPEDERARFYLGLSLLATPEYQAAAQQLLPLARSETSPWQVEAEWYLALSYLRREEDRKRAIGWLNEISANSASPYQLQARALLEALPD